MPSGRGSERPSCEEQERASARRARAARRFKPEKVRLLLVAEAAPEALDRYFYFPDVRTQDGLFREVYRVVTGREPSRERKAEQLAELRDLGVYLVDLQSDPFDDRPLSVHVPRLVSRCRRLDPERIVLIKVDVFDAAYGPLREAGFAVSDVRIPFPGRGQQGRFRELFARALEFDRIAREPRT
jgi:hypothetical protein